MQDSSSGGDGGSEGRAHAKTLVAAAKNGPSWCPEMFSFQAAAAPQARQPGRRLARCEFCERDRRSTAENAVSIHRPDLPAASATTDTARD